MPAFPAADQPRPLLAGGERLAAGEELYRSPSDKFHPYSFQETQARLVEQVQTVNAQARDVPVELRDDRTVVELTLLPNYIASTWQPTALLSNLDLVQIGTAEGRAPYLTKSGLKSQDEATKTLLLAAGPDYLDGLERILTGAGDSRRDQGLREVVRRIAEVRLPQPARIHLPNDDIDPDAPRAWELVLHPSVSLDGATRRPPDELLTKLSVWISRLGGELDVQWARQSGRITFLPVTISARAASGLAQFNPLREARLSPIMPLPATRRESRTPSEPTLGLAPRSTSPIAVFDHGVDETHPYFAGLVTQQHLTTEPATDEGIAHGTLVTSAALYGNLPAGVTPGEPSAPIHMYRVGPVAPTIRYPDVWVLDRICDVLSTGDYRIAVITVAPNRPVGAYGDAPSSWTARLDEIAKLHDVLIVTAAGNNGTPDPRPGDGTDRVLVPADAVNGLSVGAALGTPKDWTRTPYSSRGPGRAGLRIQPNVMAFGGDESLLFAGAAPDQDVGGDYGSSFSAPLVAGQLARLDATLDTRALPETLRAFAVHFADRMKDHVNDDGGHGLLSENILDVLDCESNTITVLYQDLLERNQPMSYPVPVPTTAEGNITVTWTISYLSDVDQTNPPEYTNAGLEVTWRPNLNQIRMNPPSTSLGEDVVDLDISDPAQRAMYETLLAAGWRKSNPVTATGAKMRTEQHLRDEGKWETVIHTRIGHRAPKFVSPRLWLNYLYRRDGVLQPDSESEPLPVTVLVTVRGRKGSTIYADAVSVAPFNTLPQIVPARVQAAPGT